ncbi:hypothetical protein HYN43_015705 [Mucilaginibacter celer]|uniref:Uncharacterized protein n=1 Tax=Mucilaginibacter celer TaxID=2305508 RepID=A0A494VMU2_9SPHI|nr:hypothetical protein HYN43_015705 [Mucilaginibacter celer]
MSERSRAKFSSPWFCPVCRAKASEGMVRRPAAQRSLPGDLIFGSFYQEKEQSLPAAIERANVCWITESSLLEIS